MCKLKTIFFGTPQLSVPYLDVLHQLTDLQLVVTQADKPHGRGMHITPCPVKQHALDLGLKVLSHEKLKDIYEEVKNIPFDLGVAVAFGKIFRPDFLVLPKLGILNVHFSLLPLLRGAAPVQHSLFQDFKTTGVSLFWIAPGLDDGPLFLQKAIPVQAQDNAVTLFGKLVPLGTAALAEALQQIAAGQLIKTPQTGTPTFAPMISKEESFLDFKTMTAAQIHHKVRGLACGPKARVWISINGQKELVQLLSTCLADEAETPRAAQECSPAGSLLAVESERGILVKCSQGAVWITQLHPAGKKPMPAAAYAHGHGLKPTTDVVLFHDA